MLVGLINKHLEVIRKKFATPTSEKGVKQAVNGITISITTGFGSPQVAVTPMRQKQQYYKSEQRKVTERQHPKEILEPEIVTEKTDTGAIITADLPGVKSEKDIEINNMPNSVELRAYAGNKGYFKILNVPSKYELVDKKLRDEKLRLEFSL